jgi:hypothetical protein
VLQGFALQQFHGYEWVTFVLVNVVNGADVGMVERGGGASTRPHDGMLIYGQYYLLETLLWLDEHGSTRAAPRAGVVNPAAGGAATHKGPDGVTGQISAVRRKLGGMNQEEQGRNEERINRKLAGFGLGVMGARSLRRVEWVQKTKKTLTKRRKSFYHVFSSTVPC